MEIGTIKSSIYTAYCARHYFVMGRITILPEKNASLTKEKLLEYLYGLGWSTIVAEEKGDATGKKHYHFICLGKRDKYAHCKAFMETIRKGLKKEYNLSGNEEYSLKEVKDNPDVACAYVIKENNYEQEGIDTFFLTTYAVGLIYGIR